MLLVHNYYLVLGESSRLPWVLAVDGGTSRAHQSNWHKVTATVSSSRAQGEYQQRVEHISNDFDLLAPVFVACNTDVGEGMVNTLYAKSQLTTSLVCIFSIRIIHLLCCQGFIQKGRGGRGLEFSPSQPQFPPSQKSWNWVWRDCICGSCVYVCGHIP